VRSVLQRVEVRNMEEKPIGKVIHYYDKIGVAVIKLEKGVKVGDKLNLVRDDSSFEQIIGSMQLEHKTISEGKAGQEVAVKVDQAAKEGTLVYSV